MSKNIRPSTLRLYQAIFSFAQMPRTSREAAEHFKIEKTLMDKHFRRLVRAKCLAPTGELRQSKHRDSVLYHTISTDYVHVLDEQWLNPKLKPKQESLGIKLSAHCTQYNLMDKVHTSMPRHAPRVYVSGSTLSINA